MEEMRDKIVQLENAVEKLKEKNLIAFRAFETLKNLAEVQAERMEDLRVRISSLERLMITALLLETEKRKEYDD